jgi:VCBS repeat-containing protein
VALGQVLTPESRLFDGAFSETQTFGNSANFVSDLLSSLAAGLEVELTGPLASPVNGLVDPIVLPLLRTPVAGAIAPVLGTVLTGVADPALGTLGVGIGELDVTVSPIALAPLPAANSDFVGTPEDSPANIAVLGNDASSPAGSASVISFTQPANGTTTLNPDGTITYTPNANFFGSDSFTYTIRDANGGTSTATVVVQVSAVNDAPIAVADAYAATEDTPLVVPSPGVLANDNDAEGAPLTAVLVRGPASGILTLNSDGSFTYTPRPNYSGVDSFTYQASDGVSLSAPVAVTINVGAANDAPLANPDAYSVEGDTPLVVAGPGLLANDVDTEGDVLGAGVASGPYNGTLTLNSDGSFTYIPDLGFTGTDSFTYQASDGTATSAPATVTITVGVSNTVPVAVGDAYGATEDTPLVVGGPGVLGNDTDADGDPLTAVLVRGPANGTLTLNPDGSFTYTPGPNFNGADSFTYQASDGLDQSAPVTVAIAVGAANDAPVANPDAYGATEDTPLVVLGPGVLANDFDPEGGGLGAGVVAGPSNGTLSLNPDGSFTYTPNPGFSGVDSFAYQASDGDLLSAPVTVTITVGVANDAPLTIADAYPTTEDNPLVIAGPGVLTNDIDPDGDPLTAVLVSGPANGTLTLNPDGSFTYTPNPNFTGADSFTYQASDGVSLGAPATVTITVGAVNDTPVANPDAYSVTEDRELRTPGPGVLANDIDPDGDTLTAVLASGPANGTLVLNPDGSFTYTPNPNFNGTDAFTYQASDGVSLSAPVTVALTVGAANDVPIANPDTYPGTEDTPLVVPGPGVLGNDSDADGDPLVPIVVAGPTNGSLTLNPDGSFTYTPNPNFNGADSFTYQASDGTSPSLPVTVSLVVGAVNDAPSAANDSYTLTPGQPLIIGAPGVLGNDTDVEGSPLTAIVVTGPSNGSLTLNPDGSFTYTPNLGFAGTDSFSYRASDGTSLSSIATVSLVTRAATIPQIVSLVRLGFHRQPTQIVLTFNVDMDPAGAQNLANYQLVTPGRDGRFGTRDDRRMPLGSAIYNAANRTVTLQTRALLPLNGRYRLTVRDGTAGGLTTTAGVALDGNVDGIAGGAAAIEFNRSALAGPSVPTTPQRGRVVQPRQVVQPTIRQVDPLAAQMFVNSPWVPMAIKRRFLN